MDITFKLVMLFIFLSGLYLLLFDVDFKKSLSGIIAIILFIITGILIGIGVIFFN